MRKSDAARIKLQMELARKDYSYYCRYTQRGWILGRHLKLICSEVEKLIYREVKEKILILSVPPQHGKSQCISETLPSYYLGKFPDKRVIEVSYGDDLAQRFGRMNKRKILEHGFPLFGIKLDKTSDTDFSIQGHYGKMISRGIMAGITGEPADLIIIDDPIKNRAEANSETYRERVWDEFINSIYTRLSANGVIILIMTRWHEDDLAGRIIDKLPDKCKVINIPLEAEENDILGREVGEALFPEIGKDTNWMKETKQVFLTEEGSQAWNSLMQGHPTCQEGNMIKRSWWKYYKPSELPQLAKIVISVDATFKDSDTSDYVSIGAWGKIGADIYMLDIINKRMDFPSTVKAVRYMKKKWKKASHIYVEDKANGSAIITTLRHEINGIIPVTPKESKIARVSAVSGSIEAGNIYLPEDGIYTYEDTTTTVHDFVNQCSSFPNGSHDDMVDQMSQALNKLIFSYAEIPPPKNTEYEDMTPEERKEYARKQYIGNMSAKVMTDWSDI